MLSGIVADRFAKMWMGNSSTDGRHAAFRQSNFFDSHGFC